MNQITEPFLIRRCDILPLVRISMYNTRLKKKADKLYNQYVQPMEKNHRGDYVAVSPHGQIVLDKSLLKVCEQAKETFGHDNFVFKVGEKVVGKWR